MLTCLSDTSPAVTAVCVVVAIFYSTGGEGVGSDLTQVGVPSLPSPSHTRACYSAVQMWASLLSMCGGTRVVRLVGEKGSRSGLHNS